MPQYRYTEYRPEQERFFVRTEPAKGYTFQICRHDEEGRFVSSVATLDSHGLDPISMKLASLFSNAPEMASLLFEITKRHNNDLPAELLNRIADVLDNITGE